MCHDRNVAFTYPYGHNAYMKNVIKVQNLTEHQTLKHNKQY